MILFVLPGVHEHCQRCGSFGIHGLLVLLIRQCNSRKELFNLKRIIFRNKNFKTIKFSIKLIDFASLI